MSSWLLSGILWAVLAAVSPSVSSTQSLSQHYRSIASYPFSKIVGVFSVVDEDSCTCLLLSRPCPVEIAEKSVLKARGFPCPVLTRYCCRRKRLLDASNASVVTPQHRRHSSEFYTVRPVTAPGRPEVKSRQEEVDHHVSSHPSGTNSSDESSSEVPLPTTAGVALETETQPSHLHNVVKDSSRRPKMVACSCMTREDCISSWSFFVNLPQVDIRTSLKCDGRDEITCCLGRILPPRSQKSRGANPGTSTTTSQWQPLQTVWEGLVSWLNG